MEFGIVRFPGTWSDHDCYYALHNVLGQNTSYLWHEESDISGYDCIILPGGFSYGDHLRPGAIARFSPIMAALAQFAAQGKFIIGICNGFQVLCESGLLPGVLMQNNHLHFRCQWVHLKVGNTSNAFASKYQKNQVVSIPISHYEGNYYADESTLDKLERNNRIVFRYCSPEGNITNEANPNGSLHNIAGILNEQGNILGMMPHPERACESILGGLSGKLIFESLLAH